MRSSIRLFHAVPVKEGTKAPAEIGSQDYFLKETVQHGFILSPEIIASYSDPEIKNIIKITVEEIGLSGIQINRSFHKSWKKIKESTTCQLVAEQMVHYITTYGFELLGIYNKDSVYIPKEDLEIPALEDDVPLIVIRGLTGDELMDKLMALLSSGIALKESTLTDIVDVAIYLDIDDSRLSEIANKEARVMLYDHLSLFPSNPIEFLRFLLYKATNNTLLIKNEETVNAIKASNNLQVVKLFKQYDGEHGFKKLSSIFNRFKPLFLAFKTNEKLKAYINKIGHLSKKHHVPMKEDYLNEVTSKLRRGIPIDPSELQLALDKVNVFRKVRLAIALKFRTENPSSIMYRVRNGKAFAKEFTFPDDVAVMPVLEIVINSIVKDISKAVKGKKIFIPRNIVYSLPSSEKQFTGNIPSGSFVDVSRDAIIGIHWKNVDRRIDLDLSIIGTGEKIGWDGDYMTEDKNILFSGDLTDAPGDGASELFYIKKQHEGNYILSVNYFNYEKDVKVPFTIFLAANEPVDELPSNYTVDPNTVICKAKTVGERKQKTLGLIEITSNGTRFYFSGTDIGNMRSSSMNDGMEHALDYLVKSISSPVILTTILEKAGAIMIRESSEKDACDIDLSPETIDKETFLKILAA
jgi:hypothetical protein